MARNPMCHSSNRTMVFPRSMARRMIGFYVACVILLVPLAFIDFMKLVALLMHVNRPPQATPMLFLAHIILPYMLWKYYKSLKRD
jgi:hypothetical protein